MEEDVVHALNKAKLPNLRSQPNKPYAAFKSHSGDRNKGSATFHGNTGSGKRGYNGGGPGNGQGFNANGNGGNRKRGRGNGKSSKPDPKSESGRQATGGGNRNQTSKPNDNNSTQKP